MSRENIILTSYLESHLDVISRDSVILTSCLERVSPRSCSWSLLLLCVVTYGPLLHMVCSLSPQAAELALKFLSSDKAVQVVEVIGPRLVEISKFGPVSASTLRQTVC